MLLVMSGFCTGSKKVTHSYTLPFKIRSTRQGAASIILSEVCNLKTNEGNQQIYLRAEMTNSKHDHVAALQSKKVYMDRLNGGIGSSKFHKLALDDGVPAVAVTNVSFDGACTCRVCSPRVPAQQANC